MARRYRSALATGYRSAYRGERTWARLMALDAAPAPELSDVIGVA